MGKEEIVRFVSARPYFEKNIDDIFFCLHGRKEVVVLCSDMIMDELKALPSDYIQPRLKDFKHYLDATGVKYVVEDLKNTTIV